MKLCYLLSICLFLSACKKEIKKQEAATPAMQTKNKATADSFTSAIENTHKKNDYLKNESISYDIHVKFGGKDYLSGTITQLTDGTKIRIDKKDNTKITYDSNNVFICPKGTTPGRARFDIFTWSYFQNLAYKLNDPGTIWSMETNKQLNGSMHNTAKLSFEPKTGDAPDDWYVVYKNSENNQLAGAAYIVSFGKDLALAEKEPHAIKYNNYKLVDGIPISTNWTFHMWNETDGYGQVIGEVNLSNIKFLKDSSNLYERPEDSEIVTAP